MSLIAPLIASCLVYAGTSTDNTNQGIYVARMDLTSGQLAPFKLVAPTPNPSFLETDPKRKVLFTVNELTGPKGEPGGTVSSFAIHPETGDLSWLSRQPSMGDGPCHLTLDPEAGHLLVANYISGSISVLPIDPDGRIEAATMSIQNTGHSLNPDRQASPHAHCMVVDAASRFAYDCDLGLDKVFIYHYDARAGTLTTNEPAFTPLKPGTGPRHLVFDPAGRHAYVVCELESTVTSFVFNPGNGALTEPETLSTLPASFTGPNFPAEVQIHPSGKFLYVSNRGHDSITVFAINPATGRLTWVQNQSTLGKWPRQFAIDPTGKFLLVTNQKSGTIVVLRLDPETGTLSPTGQSLPVPGPTCVAFCPVP